MSRTRLVVGGTVAALLLLWWTTGSLLVAVLILVLVALAAGLAVVVAAWARPRPEPLAAPPSTTATVDLSVPPPAAAPVRRALRTVLARPWVHGDGLLRVTAARLDGDDALVWTPRGQQVAAPHLWVEWNPVDGAEVAGRRPLEALARELAEGYVEHGRERGVRRLAERTWVHLLVSDDVPLGRVVVTAAFSEPQQTPVAAACASTAVPLAPARGAGGGPAALGPGTGWDGRGSGPVPPGSGGGRRAPGHPGDRGDLLTSVVGRGPRLLPGGRPPAAGGGLAALATRVTGAVPARLRTLVVGNPAKAVLVVEDAAGARLGDTELAGTVELGRDPAAGLPVEHPGVSWRHVRLAPDRSGGWTATDLGSTNGTRVDGRRIDGPTPVPPGAEITLGTDGPRLRLLAVADSDPATTTQVAARGY
ncbi:FHA domain-containing protein [Actinomycetospora soli]|uniref:FHA domain-containing protein n=1 Tax=Actinomycetospora soli TaxID=2893887 RepID=UPI001E476E56|nr:FHA domain-containing protein [Actinomycetospora soli]MCD2188273.1 FHA domain-containing protein [Actinomycetospora soli]